MNHREMFEHTFGGYACYEIINQTSYEQRKNMRLIDIGAGKGYHAQHFASAGFNVTTLDIKPLPHDLRNRENIRHLEIPLDRVFYIDNEEVRRAVDKGFDIVWCSHTLEHQQDLKASINRLFGLCTKGGIVAITVPPLKPNLVGGHYNLFTPASLCYNIAAAGWSCRRAEVFYYGYNISALIPKERVPHEVIGKLSHDIGDIKTIAPYMPQTPNGRDVWQDMDGFLVGKEVKI